MSNVFDAAQSVLAMLRADLYEWNRSPDQHNMVQRCATRREVQAIQGTSRGYPAPSYQFHPLATAPITCVNFSENQVSHERQSAVSGSGAAPCISSSKIAVEQPTRAAIVPSPTPALERRRKKAATSVAEKPSPSHDEAAVGQSSELSCSPPVPLSGREPSRWESRLRQQSAATQMLYAGMEERGIAAMAGAAHPSRLWRRRVECPRDAELRRAVRDYLYRMNILSQLDWVAVDGARGEEHEEGPAAFADAVTNGTALCQLVSTLLLEGEERHAPQPRQRLLVDAVPCRCPLTLEEVRVNYAAALTELRSTPAAAQELLPSAAWALLPEDVFFLSSPTALLELFVCLISTYLPSPEELPVWKPHMCWQPPADRAALSVSSPAELAAAETDCCALLHVYGVLPDPAVHSLPGSECLLPSPVDAPFMSSWKSYVARREAPPSLLTPSVWPYLCNGVLLVLLARRSGAEAAAVRVMAPGSLGTCFTNPRTASCCLANISTAFRCFQAVSSLKSSLQFFSTESASAVLRGDRLHIVSLLLHLRAVLEGKESSTPSSRQHTVKAGKTAAASSESPLQSNPVPAASTPLHQQTPASATCFSSSSPSLSFSAVKRLTPATIAKEVVRRYGSATEAEPRFLRSPSALPVHSDPEAGDTNVRDGAAAPSCSTAAARVGGGAGVAERSKDSSSNCLLQWLCRLVGPDFRYTALDHSFVFDARCATLAQPCLFFSDGVLLAHAIGLLECRRCDDLDCVQPTVKKAAKLFNVRRCLEFLRSCAGVSFDAPLLDESVVGGDVDGVLSVLRALRSHYGMARRGFSFSR